MPRTAGSADWEAGSENSSSPSSPRGRLFVISGPSGVGKSSIVNAVMAATDATFSVSATTRHPRPHEAEGVNYLFVSIADFEAMVLRDELLEWARYGGNCYGTPRSPVESALATGSDVILDIENSGARQVKEAMPEAVAIFILPPTLQELARRLRFRGDTTQPDIDRRLSVAEAQIAEAHEVYDHLVVNNDLDVAIEEVLAIAT